jgi:hypothetical protein
MPAKAVRVASCIAIFCLLSLGSLTAQTTGAILGRILTGEGAAVSGVTVTATGALPGVRTARTDADGVYRFAALPPGRYSITTEIQGFGPQQREVIVSLGATTTADFRLVPELHEQITVQAEVPAIDPHTADIGTTVDARAFTQLPLPRDYSSIALLQPGVTADGAGFSVFGATGLENSYYLDGVDVTGMRTGAQTKVIPEQFLAEVQVETATPPAEYGRALGGVVNAITRSGGNTYHGELFGYFDSQSLQAKAKPGAVGGNFAGFSDQDYGASLGGYLVRDRLWFFGVYDRTSLSRDTLLTTGSGSPFDGTTFRSQDRTQNLYAAKLTWTISPSANLVGSLIGDPSQDKQQLVEDAPETTRAIRDTRGRPDESLIGTALGGWWVAEAGLFRHEEKRDRTPVFNPPFLTANDADIPTWNLATCPLPGCFSGAPWVFIPQNEPLLRESYERRQGRGSLTGYFGHHELKVGLDGSRLSGEVRQGIPSGVSRVINQLADGTILYTQNWFGDQSGSFGADHVVPVVSGSPRSDELAAYVQDTWTPLPNVTVNAGVRYDSFRHRDAVTGGTIADLTNNFAPRLGIAWDPRGNGRSKLSFGYGRFFQAIPLNHQAGSFLGTSLSVTDFLGFSFDCGPTAVACQSFPNRFTEPADPHLKAPEEEQISFGFKQLVGTSLTLGLQAVYSNLLRAVEDRCDLQGNDAALAFTGNGCVLMNPGQGNFGRGRFPGFTFPDGTTSPILCTNGLNPEEGRASGPCLPLPAARRTYRGVAFTAEERFSATDYLLGSVLISRLRGNYDGAFNELGEGDPNTNFDFDYPGLLANAYGRLANDRPEQIKITGFHRFAFGLTAGINAYYRSGTPEDRLGSFALINGAPVPLYLAPRGSVGRTPADSDLDLHFDYGLPFKSVQVSLIADVFRVFNRQAVLRTNPFYNFDGFQGDNSVQTNPSFGAPIQRADPRLVRFGMRISI